MYDTISDIKVGSTNIFYLAVTIIELTSACFFEIELVESRYYVICNRFENFQIVIQLFDNFKSWNCIVLVLCFWKNENDRKTKEFEKRKLNA